jgi:hypothetical protein
MRKQTCTGIEAALAAIPDGWTVELKQQEYGYWSCYLTDAKRGGSFCTGKGMMNSPVAAVLEASDMARAADDALLDQLAKVRGFKPEANP